VEAEMVALQDSAMIYFQHTGNDRKAEAA